MGPGANIDPSSIKTFNEIIHRTSYSSDDGSESEYGDDNRKWGDPSLAGEGSLSVEENEDELNQNLN